MNKPEDILRKYASHYLQCSREAMEAEDIEELELALSATSTQLVHRGFAGDTYVISLFDCQKRSPVYITIERGMIFVDNHTPATMSHMIEVDDYDPNESYDTTDGCNYYSESAYADWIECGLLTIVNERL